MADEAPDDREACLLDDDLDGVRDVGEVVAGLRLLDAGRERLLADVEQPLRDRADLADRQRDGAVGDEPVRA